LLRRLHLEHFDKARARQLTENLVSLAATEHFILARSSASLVAVGCLATSLARLRQTAEQDRVLRSLLNQLCAFTGLDIKEIAECVNRLEDLIADNSATTSASATTLETPPAKLTKLGSGNSFSYNPVSSSSSSSSSSSFSGSNFCNNLISSTPTDMVDISATCVC